MVTKAVTAVESPKSRANDNGTTHVKLQNRIGAEQWQLFEQVALSFSRDDEKTANQLMKHAKEKVLEYEKENGPYKPSELSSAFADALGVAIRVASNHKATEERQTGMRIGRSHPLDTYRE